MTTTLLSETKCPACGYILNACTGVNHNEEPKDGNLTICIDCGCFLVFEMSSKFNLRLMTQEEIDNLDEETRNIMLTVSQSCLTIKK